MLQFIGIKKHVDIHIREKLTLLSQKLKLALQNLSKEYKEVLILSTCNRTEIYINHDKDIANELDKIFKILNWNDDYINYCFVLKDELVIKHLFEVSAGFHSRVLGEDQILGQIKNAYQISLEFNCISSELQRLFEEALSCGKKFRTESKLYEIPVSASSVAVSKAKEHNVKNIMIIGYGEVGKLVLKYALSSNFEKILLVLRDTHKARDISDPRVTILDFKEKNNYINDVDGIVSCTASPHIVVKYDDINSWGKNIVIFDLAVPRDVDKELKNNYRVKLYDIDDIGILDTNNREQRKLRMNEKKYIVDEYIDKFINWINNRAISNHIKTIKKYEQYILEDRIKSFENKCNDDRDLELAKKLIKSTSNYYVNRAIEVLKESRLNGCEEECLKIIEKIFMRE